MKKFSLLLIAAAVVVVVACSSLVSAVTLLGGELELNWSDYDGEFVTFHFAAPIGAGKYFAVSIATSGGGVMDGKGVACNQTSTNMTGTANCTAITTSTYAVAPREDPSLWIASASMTATHAHVAVRINGTLAGLSPMNVMNVKTLFAVGVWNANTSLPTQHTARAWSNFNYVTPMSSSSTTTTVLNTTGAPENTTMPSVNTTMDATTTSSAAATTTTTTQAAAPSTTTEAAVTTSTPVSSTTTSSTTPASPPPPPMMSNTTTTTEAAAPSPSTTTTADKTVTPAAPPQTTTTASPSPSPSPSSSTSQAATQATAANGGGSTTAGGDTTRAPAPGSTIPPGSTYVRFQNKGTNVGEFKKKLAAMLGISESVINVVMQSSGTTALVVISGDSASADADRMAKFDGAQLLQLGAASIERVTSPPPPTTPPPEEDTSWSYGAGVAGIIVLVIICGFVLKYAFQKKEDERKKNKPAQRDQEMKLNAPLAAGAAFGMYQQQQQQYAVAPQYAPYTGNPMYPSAQPAASYAAQNFDSDL